MKILLCHNYYQFPGGEDQVFVDEARLLESHGHDVVRYTVHNRDVSSLGNFRLACRTIYSRRTYHELRELLRRERPVVMHCHNTFPLISPAAYYAARSEGIPVVQTLHNFRLLCVGGLLLADDKANQHDLRSLVPWRGVWRGDYRDSRAASAVVAAMSVIHRLAGTWRNLVDRYVVLSEQARNVFADGGLPSRKLVLKRNFVDPDPGIGDGNGGYTMFVGRLSTEKGVHILLEAWRRHKALGPLKILGDGPMAAQVREAAESDHRIEWLGHRSNEEVVSCVGNASCLVVPSTCSENCPKTVLEAFARGTPPIASRIGALAEMIEDGRTGFLFTPGNADDLAARVAELISDSVRLDTMRQAARAEFETRYTAEANYRALRAIYEQAGDTSPPRLLSHANQSTRKKGVA